MCCHSFFTRSINCILWCHEKTLGNLNLVLFTVCCSFYLCWVWFVLFSFNELYFWFINLCWILLVLGTPSVASDSGTSKRGLYENFNHFPTVVSFDIGRLNRITTCSVVIWIPKTICSRNNDFWRLFTFDKGFAKMFETKGISLINLLWLKWEIWIYIRF